MHTIYTTPGLIVGSKPHGEAGKVMFIFTREFGLVTAVAQGIRLEKSKLRYNAQDYSLGIFSLVKGKEFWRLVGVEESGGFSSLEILCPLALILRRLLHGEGTQPELFDWIESVVKFLEKAGNLGEEEMKTLESLTVFRVLEMLGYIGKDSVIQKIIQSGEITRELLVELAGKRESINQHINKALRESHL